MEDFLRRSRILIVGSFLAVIGALVPVAGMLWITWSLAVEDEQAELRAVADRVLLRAQRSAMQAQAAFIELSGNDAPACSPRHVALMRRVVFNTPAIEEVGYFESGLLRCTSWGPVEGTVPAIKPDFAIAGGLQVTLAIPPLLKGGTRKLAFGSGQYNVLLDPVRFVDVIAEPQVRLALSTNDGRMIAALNEPDEQLVRAFSRRQGSFTQGALSVSVVRSRNWTAIAMERRPAVLDTLRRGQLLLIPIALFLAGLIVSIVVWGSRQRLSFRAELASAIRTREFTVHYQPIMNLATSTCIGAEALLRWRRADGRWISPELFVPVAEHAGMMWDLTEQVIDLVGADLGPLLSRDRSLHIAINLSAEMFATDRILASLERLHKLHGIEPGQVWLEATERAFMDQASAGDTISKAHAVGYRVAMDDFGTGYSSLGHLQQIDFDALKIDKSFVDTIGIASAKSAVIAHIIDLAQALKVEIIAEGVEHQAQADYLRDKGVPFAQGWLFSRALPVEDFKTFVEEQGQAV
ncbi:EAL domain-containing protein [Novosphingobium barchaimii]|uniref:EAL domain-containing protein n=1 Tax=Novosphingobium barchaimii TaxID=1420591 RepID=UPI0009E7BDA8|nr:EAL domain-containing protein [Novosphingobium barchaimii]